MGAYDYELSLTLSAALYAVSWFLASIQRRSFVP